MIRDYDLGLAATIEAAYVDMGTPVAAAKALVAGGFALYYRLEEMRSPLLHNIDRDTLLLVLQLEIIHLQHALHHLVEQVVPPGETVQ